MGAEKACPIVENFKKSNINSEEMKNINKLLEQFFVILQ